ncbi:hypothetical protein [Pseudomonas koreensis]|uniref:hypothetical protein n=1 Tax=Pseudomonas koreensis TaxID=198620 RepID=UPI002FCC34DC
MKVDLLNRQLKSDSSLAESVFGVSLKRAVPSTVKPAAEKANTKTDSGAPSAVHRQQSLGQLCSLVNGEAVSFSRQRSTEILQHLINTHVSRLTPDARTSALSLLQTELEQLQVAGSAKLMEMDHINYVADLD